MNEGAIMTLSKWFLDFLLLFVFLALVFFFIEVGGINSFKQQVNYQIERNGGLTETAMSNITNISKTKYDNKYVVQSDDGNDKKAFGEVINYRVVSKFKIKFLPMPDVNLTFSGSGISMIR